MLRAGLLASRSSSSASQRLVAAAAATSVRLSDGCWISNNNFATKRYKATAAAKKAPFTKIMAANRGEIATRIKRAASELGVSTVGIYSYEDRFTQHRYKAGEFLFQSQDAYWLLCG